MRLAIQDNVTRAYTPDDIDVVEVRVNGEPWDYYTVRGDTVIIIGAGKIDTVNIVTRRCSIRQST